jgi:hypothetical protein
VGQNHFLRFRGAPNPDTEVRRREEKNKTTSTAECFAFASPLECKLPNL